MAARAARLARTAARTARPLARPEIPPAAVEAHAAAVARGLQTYDDPTTGYTVFTELAHRARGGCCGRSGDSTPNSAHVTRGVGERAPTPTRPHPES